MACVVLCDEIIIYLVLIMMEVMVEAPIPCKMQLFRDKLTIYIIFRQLQGESDQPISNLTFRANISTTKSLLRNILGINRI